MGLFDALASGFTAAACLDQKERLCRELGWSIDERHGDTSIGLLFTGNAITPRYRIMVSHRHGQPMMLFLCHCRAMFERDRLPDTLMPALLLRNDKTALASWHANIDEDGVNLWLRYHALAAGVDAFIFQRICSLMVEEMSKVEIMLHDKGLL